MRGHHLAARSGMLAACALWDVRAGDRVGRVNANAMHQHRHEGDEYRRIELITGTERRRRWTAAEKAAVVAESLQPGINVSALARLRGISRGLLQTWRRAALRKAAEQGGVFVPLRLDGAADSAVQTPGTLEIESGGLRVRFSGPVDAVALRLVLAHMGRGA
jgi:transposase